MPVIIKYTGFSYIVNVSSIGCYFNLLPGPSTLIVQKDMVENCIALPPPPPSENNFHMSHSCGVVLISAGRIFHLIQLEVQCIWRDRLLTWEPNDLRLVQRSDFCCRSSCADRKVPFYYIPELSNVIKY